MARGFCLDLKLIIRRGVKRKAPGFSPVGMAVRAVYVPISGWDWSGVKSGRSGGLHPTLRKSAKDGAPEPLGSVEGGATRPLGRTGHPAVLGWQQYKALRW